MEIAFPIEMGIPWEWERIKPSSRIEMGMSLDWEWKWQGIEMFARMGMGRRVVSLA